MLTMTGNSAKLYCINWIDAYMQQRDSDSPVHILDSGSGTSAIFSDLLAKYPHLHYTGIEPSDVACDVARKTLPENRATIINAYAYEIADLVDRAHFDIILSFSVMEHVVQRQRYLDGIAAVMHPDSHCLINYDAGHFIYPKHNKERIKNVVGQILALVGVERYYQRFVKEADFRAMVAQAGLTIEEALSFNTSMKGIHKSVPPEHQEAHLQRWLDYEMWLNDIGMTYVDEDANTWLTRNFILKKKR
ncbi:MAG: class I SAM-dependent methyltransferase [Aggregatilineales bacterium]